MSETDRVLVVDDDADLRWMLDRYLSRHGYQIKSVEDGAQMRDVLTTDSFDLIILDLSLPGEDGLSLARYLRENHDVGIIMLTAASEVVDRVIGLEMGADDYMTKPFNPREMVARVNALLRRSNIRGSATIKEYAGIVMDLEAHRVTRDGKNVHLSPKCFRLLETLIDRPGVVFSRDKLLGRVWGGDVFVEPRTVDVHIRRLREALEVEKGAKNLIRTVRGAGYALDEQR